MTIWFTFKHVGNHDPKSSEGCDLWKIACNFSFMLVVISHPLENPNNQLPLSSYIKPMSPKLQKELSSTFNLTSAPDGGFQVKKCLLKEKKSKQNVVPCV